jgi:hypothetical protein
MSTGPFGLTIQHDLFRRYLRGPMDEPNRGVGPRDSVS